MTINNYLNQTATLKTVASRDVYNKPTLSAGTSVACRIQHGRTLDKLVNGSVESDRYDAVIYCLSTVDVDIDDIMIIDSVSYTVRDIYKAQGKSVLHHKKLYVQKTTR